ncbi:sensor histidine kinase [Caulobacter sp. NIBR2454]|uniref:sensor histidine kinase n=1 Tax=Caulobacter sp. NIBR2454 TaxID=3015996 RepID=UPI0022B744F2|nr:sensor histidine kinase [Caulobacter sp. NIBR2454]
MTGRPLIELEDAALSLTMAVLKASPSPLLLLDGALGVVAASRSFCDAFDLDPATTADQSIFALGAGEWDVVQLRALLEATAAGAAEVDAYEMELKRRGRPTRQLIIRARSLIYQDLTQQRLLVAVADITDARAGEREKDAAIERVGVLLREVRHRVANSLQIISSVLLQNAKRTKSDETRGHLKDAHHRVMSVAALERQLSEAETGGEEDVELGAYFTRLCDSIAGSMIGEGDPISLVVTGGGVVASRISINLGLIVTELVINALKHAFPPGRPGKVTIAYQARGPNWTLSVSDDGVGMPPDRSLVTPGLGTSIVQALAKQLEATVEVGSAAPGVRVSIDHTQIALLGETDDAAPSGVALERPAA